jgi:hypothetical protein
MTDIINLIQGDTANIKVQIQENGVGVNLTNYTVSLGLQLGNSTPIIIPCTKGYTDNTTTPATVYAASDGYVTVPFTPVLGTAISGVLVGQFHLTAGGVTRGWPCPSFITVIIGESIVLPTV